MKWFDRFVDVFGLSGLRKLNEYSRGPWPTGLIDQSDVPEVSWGASERPGQWPVMDREQLAEVRSAVVSVLDWIDRLDPTPLGLAEAAANVTDINTHRK